MATPVTSPNNEVFPPPPEQNDTAEADRATANPDVEVKAPTHQIEPPITTAGEVGRWVHRHKWFMHEPVTFMGYELFRSSIATIPYGFLMAAGHHLFGFMGRAGARHGLNEAGVAEFAKGGIKAVDQIEHLYKPGFGATMWRNLMRLGHSPLNQAVQIALGFTVFRFVGGLIKNLHDRVDNPKNTEEDSVREARNWWTTIKETAKINWKAEAGSTPIAALILGYIGALWVLPKQVTDNIVRNKAVPYLKQAKELIFNPKGKLLQQSGIWTISYSMFFLMAECLFKDIQIGRGLWKGHPNSLKNGPDDIVGGPAAVKYVPPEERKQQINQGADQGYSREPELATDSRDELKYPAFTGEPSIGRFLLRRILPVSVGVSAYAFAKRLGYMTQIGPEWTSGMMKPVTVGVSGFKEHAKLFLKNGFREGKATATFGVVWAAIDAGTRWYDEFFSKLQHEHKPTQPAQLNEHQKQNHAALLEQLNMKAQTAGRAA